jgi:hypothetical protein
LEEAARWERLGEAWRAVVSGSRSTTTAARFDLGKQVNLLMWRFGLGGITGINFGMSDIRDFGRESCVLNGEKKARCRRDHSMETRCASLERSDETTLIGLRCIVFTIILGLRDFPYGEVVRVEVEKAG